MSYSTIAELRANSSLLTLGNIADADVTNRITQADNIIESDLSNYIDFTLITTTPKYINLLSQYKTCELCLVYLYAATRKAEDSSDIEYWKNNYNLLLQKIIDGAIILTDGSGVSIAKGTSTFSNNAKEGIKPALGMGEFGDFKSKSDLLLDRPVD